MISTKKPLLSVTVLNYNYAHFLPTCLNSILGQSFKDFELILINDKSKDNSLEVIAPYLKDPRVRLVDHQENKGFVNSLIEGSNLSCGKYITVISADDWAISMNAFEKQIAVMEHDQEIALVYSSYGTYAKEDECILVVHPYSTTLVQPGIDFFPELLLGTALHHSGAILRKNAYDKIGGYDPKLRYAVDLQIWLGLCHIGKVAYIKEPLYAYRRHGDNMSLAPEAVRRSISEVLSIIDWSFSFLTPTERKQRHSLYKKAVGKGLTSYTALYAFNHNKLNLAWRYFLVGLQLHPLKTFFHKTTILLVLRSILGMHGYHLLIQFKNLFNKKTQDPLVTET